MDITKRFNRILQLYFVLQSKSAVTIEELENRFETSRRTIYRDLRALEQAGIPITCTVKTGYSIVEGFRMQPSRFTQEEVLSLMIAEKIMQQHETKFIKHHFESALIKIKSSFQVQQKNILDNLDDKLQINSGLNAESYLPNVIEVLLGSIVKRLAVSISYLKSSESIANTRNIEPVGLFYESNFWYVLAFCLLRKDYRNFRLDRIKGVNTLDQSFSREHLSVQEIRNQNSGATVTKISIRVDRSFAHYLYWERHHFGYKTEQLTDEHIFMQFECEIHPTSFIRWFLEFVDIAEIIEPAILNEELKTILLAGIDRINQLK
jgi:predicted DNA-binding transcriptional regulator YafY